MMMLNVVPTSNIRRLVGSFGIIDYKSCSIADWIMLNSVLEPWGDVTIFWLMLIFSKGREIDAWARQPLFDVGLTYKHGTGHGIGHYLSVHEGMFYIRYYHERYLKA